MSNGRGEIVLEKDRVVIPTKLQVGSSDRPCNISAPNGAFRGRTLQVDSVLTRMPVGPGGADRTHWLNEVVGWLIERVETLEARLNVDAPDLPGPRG